MIPLSRNYRVKLQLINESLERSYVLKSSSRLKEALWVSLNDTQPLVSMKTKLFRSKLAPTGVVVVVAMNLCMTLEAYRNRVIDVIRTTLVSGSDMIEFNLYTTESVTDTAPAPALY